MSPRGFQPEQEFGFYLGTEWGKDVIDGGQAESPHCPCVPICKMGSHANRPPGAQWVLSPSGEHMALPRAPNTPLKVSSPSQKSPLD